MSNAQLADNLGGAEFEVGSAEHRRGLARFFVDSHIDYEPEKIRWPTLGETERTRLISLPSGRKRCPPKATPPPR